VWLLSSVVDVHGNGWTVDYKLSANGATAVPARITYTTSAKKSVPTYTILFGYEARSDQTAPPSRSISG
jgi:hypothetical protein